ncbi:MAG: LysE family translocator [Alcanivorax sp.]|nr:LysE family translocator [Alcanivorax sp.]
MLALLPSTSVALVVVRSSTAGFRHGAAVSAGIVLGDLVFVFLAVLGMTALAEVMGGLFLILRYLAGIYLIWFGISLIRSKASLQSAQSGLPVSGHSAPSMTASFLSGLILTLGDLKAILFYASLFPVFVDLTAISAFDIAIIIALTVVAVGGVKLGYAYYSATLTGQGGPLGKGLAAARSIKVTAGSLMVGAGAYLLVKP